MEAISLRSGLTIHRPADRLLRFCREEFDYYDGVPKGDPNRIEPLDVLATVGLNSRIDTAVKVRTVHRGMALACDPLLQAFPEDAALLTFEPINRLHELFAAAMTSKYVLISRASKVLHRKRPGLIPVLDQFVVAHYVKELGERDLLRRSWTGRRAAAEVGRLAVRECREDLRASLAEIEELRGGLDKEGFPLSPVRVLDILVWTQVEPAGSYRL